MGMKSLWKDIHRSLTGYGFSDSLWLPPSWSQVHPCSSICQGKEPRITRRGCENKDFWAHPQGLGIGGLRVGPESLLWAGEVGEGGVGVLTVNSTGLTASLVSYCTSLCLRYLIYKLVIRTSTSQGSCEDYISYSS